MHQQRQKICREQVRRRECFSGKFGQNILCIAKKLPAPTPITLFCSDAVILWRNAKLFYLFRSRSSLAVFIRSKARSTTQGTLFPAKSTSVRKCWRALRSSSRTSGWNTRKNSSRFGIIVEFESCLNFAGFLRSMEKYGKHFGHFPAWKSLEKIFWSVSMEKGNNFADLIFWHTFS